MTHGPTDISEPLTGVLYEAGPGDDYQLYGYVRVAGARYKVYARRSDQEGRPRWLLRLALAERVQRARAP